MEVRYGLRHTCNVCGTIGATFHKISERRAYACSYCGHHVYPCAGTVFQDTRTSLLGWFYTIFLFITQGGLPSARSLQQTLGVTYKTAWRISKKIRDTTGASARYETVFRVPHLNSCGRNMALDGLLARPPAKQHGVSSWGMPPNVMQRAVRAILLHQTAMFSLATGGAFSAVVPLIEIPRPSA